MSARRSWVSAIAEAHGWSGAIVSAPPELLPEHLRATFDTEQHLELDSSRIRAELSYVEPVPLRDALARTIEWERANPPAAAPAFDYASEDRVFAEL